MIQNVPMDVPKTLLMTVVLNEGPPTLERAAEQLGVRPADLTTEFGVILVDPDSDVYCVEVLADSLPPDKSAAEASEPYPGPFSNPPIQSAGMDQEEAGARIHQRSSEEESGHATS
jgi:hypothetical protein